MSNIPPNVLAVFQEHFGIQPGGQDAQAECEKWQRLCSDLLADRERLRAQLERAQLDKICKDFKPELTMDMVYAQVDRETTMEQIFRDLEDAVDP